MDSCKVVVARSEAVSRAVAGWSGGTGGSKAAGRAGVVFQFFHLSFFILVTEFDRFLTVFI